MAQSTIQNIYSHSFSGVNAMEVSLVKDTNPELKFFKNKYFCFVSIVPGIKNQDGSRGFDREKKLTIKTDCHKLLALAHSIRFWARGEGKTLGTYSIFVDSSKSSYGGGSKKMVYCGEFIPNGKGPESRQVSINFKQDQGNPFGISFFASEALAVADVLEMIGRKGMDLEFEGRTVSVGAVRQPSSGGGGQSSGAQNAMDDFEDAAMGGFPSDPNDVPF